jgi:DNA-binding HxlR family transcriptional regulator
MEGLSNLGRFNELMEDAKKLKRDLSSKPLNEVLDDMSNFLKKANYEGYKATKTILLLKPEKSVTAEKAYEELSLLLVDLKQYLTIKKEKSEITHKLDNIISKMAKIKVLLNKSFESPNPIIKRIINMTSSELSKSLKNLPKTKRVKKSIYTQSKITSFTSKGD